MGSALWYKQGRNGKHPHQLSGSWAPRSSSALDSALRARPGCGQRPAGSLFRVFPAAEANAISENTETLHLSPPVSMEHVGRGEDKGPEVCEQSCEELGSMIRELSGLHVIVNQLHENLRKVVGARGPSSNHE